MTFWEENKAAAEVPLSGAETGELTAFRAEIRAIKNAEAAEGKTAHLIRVDPAVLVKEDLTVWRAMKDGSLTKKKFTDYYWTIGKKETARKHFSDFLANKIGTWNENGTLPRPFKKVS